MMQQAPSATGTASGSANGPATGQAPGPASGSAPGPASGPATATPPTPPTEPATATPPTPPTPWLIALRDALGSDNVIAGDSQEVEEYLDPFPFVETPTRPAAIVRPGSVADVQAVLAVAREHGLPLWTVSRGRNFAYGGAEARRAGTVVCDLGRMNRVISVDEVGGSAIIEPGVSFQSLDEHLRATGSRLAVSVPDLSWGSLIGNTLERGFSYTSHSEHQATQCGMEVVLADGDVLRTGMGALPNNTTWGLYRGAFGPGFDGLFMQSNFGIVTKMGIWLRPRPERAAVCTVSVPRDDQLGDLVATLQPLMLNDVIQSNAVVGNALIATSAATTRDRFFTGQGLMPDAAIRAAMAEFGLGRWNAQFAIYGSPQMLAARRAEIERAVAALPGAILHVTEYDGDVDPKDVAPEDRTQLGIPSNDAISMVAWRGGVPSHADIGVVCAPTAEDTNAVRHLVGSLVEATGLDYAAGFMIFRRHVVALCLLMFDGEKAIERSQVGGLIAEVMAAASAAGYGPYRAHVLHMDVAAEQYSYNDHAALRLSERLKDALDPDGILAPGKQGIWPAGALRDAARSARSRHN